MTQIINHNPQDNPHLNELYQILLLAGYFRIRIASLKAFDKVIGGLAWCITSSNFAIDIQFSDEMQIGQKIKVSEKICQALTNMKCPYSLQPFQLQGLDVNSIYPIVQWLVKYVYETRYESQKYNRQLSYLLGKRILGNQNKGNVSKIQHFHPRRTKVNRAISTTAYSNPLRVYSSLLQFNDVSSIRMYNKLLTLATQQSASKNKKAEGKQGQQKEQLMNYFQQYQKETEEAHEASNFDDFGQIGQLELKRLEKLLQLSKNQIEEGIAPRQTQQYYQNLTQNLSTEREQSNQQNHNQPSMDDRKILHNYKIQNDTYQIQLKALNNQYQSLNGLQDRVQSQLDKLTQKYDGVYKILEQLRQERQQILSYQAEIDAQLKQNDKKLNKNLEKLVDKRTQLKLKKAEIKKNAKAKIQDLQTQKQMSLNEVPQIDEQAFNKMQEEAELKKKIYDKKYEHLTAINQQLAILQRKAQKFTSPAQIAQYHQRFIQLFEGINELIQQKRSMYSQTTNLEGIKKFAINYLDIISKVKENLIEARKKNQKKQLADSLKQILEGLQANMKNGYLTLNKIQSKKQQNYSQYMDLIKLQRQYLKYLRILKLQYENAQKLYQ